MELSRLQRVLRLVSILQTNRFSSPDELAVKLKVSRRTVFRDLDTLRRAGIPYYHDDDKGGYKISDNVLLPPLNLDLEEAMALLLLTSDTANPYAMPLSQQTQRAALKIESALPGHVQRHCAPVLKETSTHYHKPTTGQDGRESLGKLQSAIRQNRKVKIRYDSFYEKMVINTTVSPYHLHFANRAWYVIGYSSMHRQDRTFKLGRILEIEVLTQRYIRDKEFNIDKYLGQAWAIIPEGKLYNVKLCFAPMVAANVAEVLWHKTQKLSWHKDGSLVFEVQVDGLTEISWWILGYGDQVEVLAPKPLQERISQAAQRIVQKYEQAMSE
jgi:predicted DNA-binding transcriptional regulator YafY